MSDDPPKAKPKSNLGSADEVSKRIGKRGFMTADPPKAKRLTNLCFESPLQLKC